MSQKSSLPQVIQSVSEALMPDIENLRVDVSIPPSTSSPINRSLYKPKVPRRKKLGADAFVFRRKLLILS
jgi:hypothetical protein